MFNWPGDVSGYWTPKDIYNVIFPEVLGKIAVTRAALDANTNLPVAFGRLIVEIEACYQLVPSLGWAMKAVLQKTNLIPAAIPRADYSFLSPARYPVDSKGSRCGYTDPEGRPVEKGLTGDLSMGVIATEFAKRHNSLWWDSDLGASTVKALKRIINGDLVPGACNTAVSGGGERNRPTPFWLTTALQALGGGEDWLLKLNAQQIVGTGGIIESARTWLPEARWFGWAPIHSRPSPAVPTTTQTSDYRNSANAALTTLTNRLGAISAVQATTEATAAVKVQAVANVKLEATADKLGITIPNIPPPGGRPAWQKALAAVVIGGGAIAGLSWLKDHRKT
jgi:hypothetical protein